MDIETIFVDRYLFVQVQADEGITGLGESGAWDLEASAGAIDTVRHYREALGNGVDLCIELAPDALERHPYRPRAVRTRLHRDGSVIDQ